MSADGDGAPAPRVAPVLDSDWRGRTLLLWCAAAAALFAILMVPAGIAGFDDWALLILVLVICPFPGTVVLLAYVGGALAAGDRSGRRASRSLVLCGPLIAFIAWLPGMHVVQQRHGWIRDVGDEPLILNMLLMAALAVGLAFLSARRPHGTRACWPLAILGACAINATFPVMLYVGY